MIIHSLSLSLSLSLSHLYKSDDKMFDNYKSFYKMCSDYNVRLSLSLQEEVDLEDLLEDYVSCPTIQKLNC